jgi:hypothetical protein
MFRTRLLGIGLALASSAQAQPRVLPNISASEFFGGLFVLGFAIPAILGSATNWVLRALKQGPRVSFPRVVITAVLTWWIGWWLLLIVSEL